MNGRRRGLTRVELPILIALACLPVAFVLLWMPEYQRQDPAGASSCADHLKSATWALEMWQAERPGRTPGPDLFAVLVRGGYLHAPPVHRLDGEEVAAHYVWVPGTSKLICPEHGLPEPAELSAPRAQLVDLGVTDAALLARVSGITQREREREHRRAHAAPRLLALALVLWVAGRRRIAQQEPERERLTARGILERLEVPVGAVPAPPSASASRCPVCAEARDAAANEVLACGRCGVLHHRECHVYLGTCGIYGCRG